MEMRCHRLKCDSVISCWTKTHTHIHTTHIFSIICGHGYGFMALDYITRARTSTQNKNPVSTLIDVISRLLEVIIIVIIQRTSLRWRRWRSSSFSESCLQVRERQSALMRSLYQCLVAKGKQSRKASLVFYNSVYVSALTCGHKRWVTAKRTRSQTQDGHNASLEKWGRPSVERKRWRGNAPLAGLGTPPSPSGWTGGGDWRQAGLDSLSETGATVMQS